MPPDPPMTEARTFGALNVPLRPLSKFGSDVLLQNLTAMSKYTMMRLCLDLQ